MRHWAQRLLRRKTKTRTEMQAMKGTDMRTTPRVWISPQAHERLHRELDTLRFLFSAGIADGDTDENAVAVRLSLIHI